MRKIKFRNQPQSIVKKLFSALIFFVMLSALAVFFDWLLLNTVTRCCEGGVCVPDVYPHCRNPHYDDFYGEGYYERTRKAD